MSFLIGFFFFFLGFYSAFFYLKTKNTKEEKEKNRSEDRRRCLRWFLFSEGEWKLSDQPEVFHAHLCKILFHKILCPPDRGARYVLATFYDNSQSPAGHPLAVRLQGIDLPPLHRVDDLADIDDWEKFFQKAMLVD